MHVIPGPLKSRSFAMPDNIRSDGPMMQVLEMSSIQFRRIRIRCQQSSVAQDSNQRLQFSPIDRKFNGMKSKIAGKFFQILTEYLVNLFNDSEECRKRRYLTENLMNK